MATNRFIKLDSDTHQFICQGHWTLSHINALKKELKKIAIPKQKEIIIHGESIKKMDSAGAAILNQWLSEIKKRGITFRLENFSEQHQQLLSLTKQYTALLQSIPKIKKMNWIGQFGKKIISQLIELNNFLSFTGYLFLESLRVALHPFRFRWSALASVIEKAGFQALMIVALLSFMIGIVITYLTGIKLKSYGANIFIVDLVGFAILREFGPLITAIMVAGRTGSAFTAQLGIMKINQEVDALNTMGVTPAELLILPRIFGLVIALPLLTIWADVFGVIGGIIMSNNIMNITLYEFLDRFQHEVPLRALLIGLGKAPIFALIIASIGCYQGMYVQRNASSVGERTTKSVVWSIFFIIVTDAILSVIFSKLKL